MLKTDGDAHIQTVQAKDGQFVTRKKESVLSRIEVRFAVATGQLSLAIEQHDRVIDQPLRIGVAFDETGDNSQVQLLGQRA